MPSKRRGDVAYSAHEAVFDFSSEKSGAPGFYRFTNPVSAFPGLWRHGFRDGPHWNVYAFPFRRAYEPAWA